MSLVLLEWEGGRIVLPELVLLDRADGGHLCVNPKREVWERGELTARELTLWSFLVAATGKGMLLSLPQLEGGCINYWEAGNWALHDEAAPPGPKIARDHRKMHLHLFGRSRAAAHPSWRWGEAPRFPDYASRERWAEGFQRLTPDECRRVVSRTREILRSDYGATITVSEGDRIS